MPRPEPVAIVGAGVTTPIGQDVAAFWSALLTGTSGISPIDRFPVADLRVRRGGEIKTLTRIRHWGRVPDCRATRLLVSAADELGAQAGLRPWPVDPARVAVVVGTALGGVDEWERAHGGDRRLKRLRGGLYDTPAHNLARWLGARGPVLTVSTACASGATALGLGADLLRQDGRCGGGRRLRLLSLRDARLTPCAPSRVMNCAPSTAGAADSPRRGAALVQPGATRAGPQRPEAPGPCQHGRWLTSRPRSGARPERALRLAMTRQGGPDDVDFVSATDGDG